MLPAGWFSDLRTGGFCLNSVPYESFLYLVILRDGGTPTPYILYHIIKGMENVELLQFSIDNAMISSIMCIYQKRIKV